MPGGSAGVVDKPVSAPVVTREHFIEIYGGGNYQRGLQWLREEGAYVVRSESGMGWGVEKKTAQKKTMKNTFWRIITSVVIVPDALTRDTGIAGDPQGDIRTGYAVRRADLTGLARADRSEGGKPVISKVRFASSEQEMAACGSCVVPV